MILGITLGCPRDHCGNIVADGTEEEGEAEEEEEGRTGGDGSEQSPAAGNEDLFE